jgi:hypothetical protein
MQDFRGKNESRVNKFKHERGEVHQEDLEYFGNYSLPPQIKNQTLKGNRISLGELTRTQGSAR